MLLTDKDNERWALSVGFSHVERLLVALIRAVSLASWSGGGKDESGRGTKWELAEWNLVMGWEDKSLKMFGRPGKERNRMIVGGAFGFLFLISILAVDSDLIEKGKLNIQERKVTGVISLSRWEGSDLVIPAQTACSPARTHHRPPNFLWFSSNLPLTQWTCRTAVCHLGRDRVVRRKETLKSEPCLTSAQLWESCAGEDPDNLLEQRHIPWHILSTPLKEWNFNFTPKKAYFYDQYDKKAVLFHFPLTFNSIKLLVPFITPRMFSFLPFVHSFMSMLFSNHRCF